MYMYMYICIYIYLGSVFIGHADIEAQAEVMQGWVVGTLDTIPEESTPHACNHMHRACSHMHRACDHTDRTCDPCAPRVWPYAPQESIAHATLSRIITAETDERRFNLVRPWLQPHAPAATLCTLPASPCPPPASPVSPTTPPLRVSQVDLALFLNMKRVLSQRYVQTLIDRIWRGDVGDPMYPLPLGVPWWQVPLRGAVVPCIRGFVEAATLLHEKLPSCVLEAVALCTRLATPCTSGAAVGAASLLATRGRHATGQAAEAGRRAYLHLRRLH